ncbi:MAG TPA: hypothetical protein VFS20_09775 [Longimicrobium sp.]|nr:hypothetical protein [Longimicrobium sp.]
MVSFYLVLLVMAAAAAVTGGIELYHHRILGAVLSYVFMLISLWGVARELIDLTLTLALTRSERRRRKP